MDTPPHTDPLPGHLLARVEITTDGRTLVRLANTLDPADFADRLHAIAQAFLEGQGLTPASKGGEVLSGSHNPAN